MYVELQMRKRPSKPMLLICRQMGTHVDAHVLDLELSSLHVLVSTGTATLRL